MTWVALDYPLRRAGEGDTHPALGSLAFYLGCVRELLVTLSITSYMWVILFILALCAVFVGFGVTSWRSRIFVSLVILILPITAFSLHAIYRHMKWAANTQTTTAR